jgi:hypothetical protein
MAVQAQMSFFSPRENSAMKTLIGIVLIGGIVGASYAADDEPTPLAASAADVTDATSDGDLLAQAPSNGLASLLVAQIDAQVNADVSMLVNEIEALLPKLADADTSDDADVKAKIAANFQAILVQLQAGQTCSEYTPNCPVVKPCDSSDACVVFAVSSRQANFTARGVHSFASIFSAAAARGVENATIRAMNATEACATCTPQDGGFKKPPTVVP